MSMIGDRQRLVPVVPTFFTQLASYLSGERPKDGGSSHGRVRRHDSAVRPQAIRTVATKFPYIREARLRSPPVLIRGEHASLRLPPITCFE